ncbi:MAG TPA: pitrilysin family protein [Thermoanaerobaculia bacterium]|nr:pitrilysin family protein [Thermoanaerobaculia bacterium]
MRRLIAPLLFSAALPLAAAAPAIPYEMFRLQNGLTVIVHEDRSRPVVAVNLSYHVGSSRERAGRTGFAHLFEHIMFNGSKNVPMGAFDKWLEAVGGDNNGSTSNDRTNYWEIVPSNAVETALFLESDRMGWLLDSMTPERVNQQRDVVKNERRQSYENRPYGMAEILIGEALFPKDHPYHWPVIGYMDDLTAASDEDVKAFFRTWYGPANASLVLAGDIDAPTARALAEKWFGDIPPSPRMPPPAAPPFVLTAEKRLVHEDEVDLPRLYVAWPTPPIYAPADAALDAVAGVLAMGKNSRLYRTLVYEKAIAQDVSASQGSAALGSTFEIVATARKGHDLTEIYDVVNQELARLAAEPPTPRELDRARNRFESGYFARLERLGGFGGRSDLLNDYYLHTGNPGFLEGDLARYRSLTPADIRAAVFSHLGPGRVVLSVVPRGKMPLAVGEVTR